MQRVPTITFGNTSQFKIVGIMRRRHLTLMCLARWLSTSLWRTALRAVRTSRTLPCSIRTLLMGCFLNGYSSLRTWVSFFALEPSLSLLFFVTLSTIHTANDGHDSSITVAGQFANSFLSPLLANSNFNSARTLVFLSMFFSYQEIPFDHQLTLTNPILFSFRWNFIQYFSKPGRRNSPR